MIVMLLTGNLKPDWKSFKKLAGDLRFMEKLINFDFAKVPPRVINACRKYFRNANLDVNQVRNVSMAAASMFVWL